VLAQGHQLSFVLGDAGHDVDADILLPGRESPDDGFASPVVGVRVAMDS
jgi:hypothetical protein